MVARSFHARALICGFLVALVLSSSGCAGRLNKAMNSWMGSNVGDLIASWGPPQQVFDDGQGGQVLLWNVQRNLGSTPATAQTTTTLQMNRYGTRGTARSSTVYTPSQTYGYTAYRMFWADKNGRIYRWSWKGL